jgi:hypothetical protein
VLARAEQVVEALRKAYVCDGWAVDEQAAARSLQYFRSRAAGRPDDGDEWMATVQFIGSHGQSLDWVVGGDPGGMICAGASRSSRASVGDDPIFAVIAEHHAIMAEWRDALRREHEFRHTPEGAAGAEAASVVCSREKAHLLRVLTVQPTTIAGVAALLNHVGQEEFLNSGDGDDDGSDETVLSSWCNTNDGEPLKEAAMSFPLRLAATMRSLIGGQS